MFPGAICFLDYIGTIDYIISVGGIYFLHSIGAIEFLVSTVQKEGSQGLIFSGSYIITSNIPGYAYGSFITVLNQFWGFPF